jgi:hypothetical protein
MRTKHTLQSYLHRSPLHTVGFGIVCALFAFGVGLETAGEVHPFDTSEAAVQENVLRVSPKGDIDGDGVLTPQDAALILTFAEDLETPNSEELRRGDSDGDFMLTYRDALRVLHALSAR